jgi:hypothetical protein
MRFKNKFSNNFGNLSISIIASAFFLAEGLLGATASITTAKSTLAIVTQKEGIASGLAHRHIIVGAKWSATLDLKKSASANQIESGTATISIPSAELIVDSPEAAKGIIDVLKAGKIWDPASDKLSPENAEKVRENMVVDSQLAIAKFPVIEGRGSFSSCRKLSDAVTECALDLSLKVRDRNVSKRIPVTVTNQGGELSADFLGKFKFTEFGIKPYTAMMGAIAVSDEFVLAGKLIAQEG